MSTLNTTQIPTGINSVERLAAYSLLLLTRLNPDLKVIETSGSTVRVVESVIIPADDGSIRLVGRFSLPLDPDYITDTVQPLYMNIQDISNVTIPSDWLQA
jgi:hypothetical protein